LKSKKAAAGGSAKEARAAAAAAADTVDAANAAATIPAASNGAEGNKKKLKHKNKDKTITTATATATTAPVEAAPGVASASTADGTDRRAEKARKRTEPPPAEAADGAPAKKKTKKAAKLVDGKRDLARLAADAAAANEAATAPSQNGSDSAASWTYREDPRLTALPQSRIDEFLTKHAVTLRPGGTPLPPHARRPVLDFAHARLPAALAAHFDDMGFKSPTPIQACAWPPLFVTRDLVGVAATGSGKTLAFGVPLLLRVAAASAAHAAGSMSPTHASAAAPRALVVAPTRELAVQIADVLTGLAAPLRLRVACLYGGAPKPPQRAALRARPHVVVATPGRLRDFVDGGDCALDRVGFFVLDEADRMLDLGFEPDIRAVATAIGKEGRQTVMFSATWPPTVVKMSQQYLSDPVHITVGSVDLSANAMIEQHIEVMEPFQKDSRLQALLRTLSRNPSSGAGFPKTIVFALYKAEAMRLEESLRAGGYRDKVTALHGNLNQAKRDESIEAFRSGSRPLLVATDVAARGLDVPDVQYVINYTYPLTTDEYCHRIGRTGRAGRTGVSHTFFTPHDRSHSGALINVLKQAGQPVPDALLRFGTTVKKKVDANYGAFVRDIDPAAKPSRITFGDDDD
ncbi:hypothetical protein HK405_008979, partial [Cladochytrium tenue]